MNYDGPSKNDLKKMMEEEDELMCAKKSKDKKSAWGKKK